MNVSQHIVMRAVADLEPYTRNARTHSPKQIAQIAASIQEFGFTNPVLIGGKNGIVAGHARVLAAKQLGMSTVATISLDYLTPAQRRAYIIADNQLALNAGWDIDLLGEELQGLKDDDFDLSLLGFDDVDLDRLLGPAGGLTDPDDVPDVPEEPVSRTGDLWVMGRHRLLCGDATVAADVERMLEGVKPHLMVGPALWCGL